MRSFQQSKWYEEWSYVSNHPSESQEFPLICLAVVKPPMAKMADVWGRFEAFTFSVVLFTIGYIQQAGAKNVRSYAAAQIFYSSGATGLQILQQIFIADTSDLTNRALVSTIPDIPYLINVWIGPPIASSILKSLSWRWGYGIWAIILPIAFLPLGLSLYINQRKAALRGLLPPSPFAGKSWFATLQSLWYEMDFFGLLLLLAGVALILLPLTLAASAKNAWENPSILAMLIVGVVCLIAFPLWERSPRLAPRAFFPPHLFKNTTVLAGVALAFFYFSKWMQPPHSAMTNLSSGILPVCTAILLLIPACRAEPISNISWTYHSNFHVYSHCHFDHHIASHQVHQTLQVLCNHRLLYLHGRHYHDAPLPDRRSQQGLPYRLPNRRGDRRRHAPCPCTTRRSGIRDALRGGFRNRSLPHDPRNRWRSGLIDFRRNMVEQHSAQAGRILA